MGVAWDFSGTSGPINRHEREIAEKPFAQVSDHQPLIAAGHRSPWSLPGHLNALRKTAPHPSKIATTVDVVSRGWLVKGLGVGGTHQPAGAGGIAGDNPAVAEYEAYGLTLVPPREGVERLEETVTILKRMWTEKEFDFEGRYYTLKGNRNEPKPVQPSGPPLLIGGWGDKTLRLVAEHADIWNIPGPPHNQIDYIAERSRVLDEHCAAIGRDPSEISRSVQVVMSYDNIETSRRQVLELIHAGLDHIVLSLPRGYPQGVAQWLTDEIIKPVRAELPVA